MKNLIEYIYESEMVDIFESGKGGFNIFFNTAEECIEGCKSSDMEYISKHFNITDSVIKKLYDISDGEIPLTFDPKHKWVKLRRYFKEEPYFSKIISLGSFNSNKEKFKFNGSKNNIMIGDGGLSKRAKSGANTKPQELLLCEVINKNGDVDYNELLTKYELSPEFEFSAKTQYDKFKKYIDNDDKYYAYRSDYKKDEIINTVNDIYEIIHKTYHVDKRYITPVDIYAIKEKTKKETLTRLKDLLGNLKDINNKDVIFNKIKVIFFELINSFDLIPISIKKIIKSSTDNKVELLNVDKYTIDIDKENYFIYFTKNGLKAEFNLSEGEKIAFNYRSNQEDVKNYTFEFNKSKDGGAVGKFKKFIIDYIDSSGLNINFITPSEFREQYKDNKDFNLKEFYDTVIKDTKKNFKDNFKDSNYSKEDIDEIFKDEKLFYGLIQILTCLDLFNKLNEKDDFFNFIESCYLAAKKISKYSLPYILIK